MKPILKYLTFSLAVLVSSCDFLEVEPVSEITSANFFQKASDANAALIACYDGLQKFNYSRDNVLIPGIMSDEALASAGGNFLNHQSFNPSANQGNVQDHWRESYSTIQRCMDLIANVPAVSDPALNKDFVLGEAYFIKSLVYFNLVKLFGDLPVVEVATKSPSQDFNIKRTPASQVYEMIISDLIKAEELLPATNGLKSRATKGATRALLARVYMYRHAAGDFAKALAECEEVMADNQYILMPKASFGDIFTSGKQNTAESIFEISYRPNIQQAGDSNFDDETVPGNRFRVRPDPKIISAFRKDSNDVRMRVSLGNFENTIYIKKHQAAPPKEPRTLHPNFVVLRLADIILMRAECLNELGKTGEAIPFLNQIRVRAGLKETSAVTVEEVRQAIEDERFLELAFEGTRWFDLVRTDRVQTLVPSLTNKERILWPIPAREIDLNPSLLPQNPSYQ